MNGQRFQSHNNCDDMIRINKFLSDAGVCSRREADRLLVDGRITVNGTLAILGQKMKLTDEIALDGQSIVREKERVLIALNKPVGIECTSDLSNPNNIIDFVAYPKRIYPIGRLDKNSQGLILLTNDGSIVNPILKASAYHEKEYIVTVDKQITEFFIKRMSAGVKILNTTTRPCQVVQISRHTFRIILTQGLNRQIRRMCGTLGYHVQKLKRVRIMNIELGNLALGQYRDVTGKEFEILQKNL